jgi:hypothetical protein
MTHTTAKLGGPASGVVIAKVAVCYPVLLLASSPLSINGSHFVDSMGLCG